MEEEGMRNSQWRGVKHYFNVHSGVEFLRDLPEVLSDYVRFPHVAHHGVGALDWRNLKEKYKGVETYQISC